MMRHALLRIALSLFIILAATAPLEAFRAPEEENLPALQDNSFALTEAAVAGNDAASELETVDINQDQPLDSGLDSVTGSPVETLLNRSGSRAKERRTHSDEFGKKHIRMGQYYRGIPVFGGDIIEHRDSRNRVERVSGKVLPRITCETTPALEGDVALQIGLDEHAGKKGIKISRQPSLVIHGQRLAFHYVLTHGGKDPGEWHYYVCAHTGSILNRFNNIKFLAPAGGSPARLYGSLIAGEGGASIGVTGWKNINGPYFLYNRAFQFGIFDMKLRSWKHRARKRWLPADRTAVSCAYNLFLTQRWVRSELGRNSFDDRGGLARANIRYGTNYVNAFWDGRGFFFGEGDGIASGPLVSLDIVAHEYGHALTQYTSDLVYYGESGALNESYSDILACAVEWANQPVNLSGMPGFSDWMLGEDSWLASPALRDMRNPKAYGQPSYYKGEYWYSGTDDNGGVHTNSGVQNFAFYLLAYGGTGSNEGTPYSIQGIGSAAAAKVAMRANTVYLTSTAKYLDSRRAWVRAARDLGHPVQTLHAVWNAVGVFDPLVP